MKVDQKVYLEALLKERDQLLEEFPELKKYQLEIDSMLLGIEDPEERCLVLMSALMDKLKYELLPAKSAGRKISNQLSVTSKKKAA